MLLFEPQQNLVPNSWSPNTCTFAANIFLILAEMAGTILNWDTGVNVDIASG